MPTFVVQARLGSVLEELGKTQYVSHGAVRRYARAQNGLAPCSLGRSRWDAPEPSGLGPKRFDTVTASSSS